MCTCTPGSLLCDQLLLLQKRIVVLISADLAHTHDKDGPYGYSSAAEPFDQVSMQRHCLQDLSVLHTPSHFHLLNITQCLAGFLGY